MQTKRAVKIALTVADINKHQPQRVRTGFAVKTGTTVGFGAASSVNYKMTRSGQVNNW